MSKPNQTELSIPVVALHSFKAKEKIQTRFSLETRVQKVTHQVQFGNLCTNVPPGTPPEIGDPVSTNIVWQLTVGMWLKSTTCLYAFRTKTCIEKNSNKVQLLVLARSWFPGSVLARTQNVEPVVWVMILQKVELVIWLWVPGTMTQTNPRISL